MPPVRIILTSPTITHCSLCYVHAALHSNSAELEAAQVGVPTVGYTRTTYFTGAGDDYDLRV
eukprot:3874-Heterococcus_DN1.PRE.3